MWGLPPPEGCLTELWWGARAIFKQRSWETNGRRKLHCVPASIDLVYDRQSFAGVKHPEKDAFVGWINGEALPVLRKWMQNVSGASRERFCFKDGPFVMEATPNASYGYMYIGAWHDPTVQKGGQNEKEVGDSASGSGS